LEDEEKSGINKYLLQAIKEKKFSHLRILEVDNVCDAGQDIHLALQSF